MGKIIKNKIKGMSWQMKVSLVLFLTVVTSIFMYAGWYKPNGTEAAISTLSAWSNVYNATTAPGTVAYTMTAGSNRMLVVGVSGTLTAAATQTMTLTYGGQTMTKVVTNETTTARNHVWLFRLNEAGIAAATNSNLVFTITGGSVRFYQVDAAVFAGVDQSATPISSSQVWTNDGTASTTVGPFATALSVGNNEQAVEIVALTRYAGTTPRTITFGTNWTQSFGPTTLASTDSINLYIGADTTSGTTTSSHTASNTTNGSMAAISIKPYIPPPTAGTVSVSPDNNGTFTSPTPTIKTVFTSPDAAVTACQYTTNGTTWAAGTVSGTGPTYTCTASPTGLTGSVTINMNATNSGGTTTATAITRTVDSAGPTDGTLTVSPGNLEFALAWTAATDGTGSGVDHYDVRFLAGATAPTCSTGTLLYSGTGRNYTHSGLTNGSTYSYRVCAVDEVGNFSAGATGSAAATTKYSAINSCGGCHGYTRTSNPPADGTARNVPVGEFLGSHATHTGGAAGQYAFDCTNCHVNNTANNHQNGTIEMANPLHGDTGAAYGKGSSWAVTNAPTAYQSCSNTYCHSKGTSLASGVIPANTTPTWGSQITTCNVCHGVESGTNGAPGYANLKKFPGTATGTNWTTPANISAADSNDATFNGTTQNNLVITSYGYTTTDIPDTDTITGIYVVVDGSGASATAAQRQVKVQLTKNGTAGVGDVVTAIQLPQTTDADVLVKGTTNLLWGTTWLPSEVRAATFGVLLADNDTTAAALNIDTVKIIVTTAASPKMNSHARHVTVFTCDICHNGTTTNGTTIANYALHNNGAYDLQATASQSFTYVFSTTGGTCSNISCHGDAKWGVNTFGCVDCHNKAITRTKGRPGKTLANAVAEFGLAYGHKKSGRGTVTNADCIVCHLEGDSTTGRPSAKHMDGNIDLRDPDVQGETPITNISGGVFTFQRFSTSYTSGSRTSTGHTSNTDIANVITQKFCLKCHDADGAKNTTARSGASATQYMPWNGVNLGANYTVLNGAAVAGGLVNVFSQFSSGNSSYHPVRAPLNKDFPTATLMQVPYKPTGTRGTQGTKSLSVVMNCFDCHNNNVGSLLTLRTISAHGTNNSSQVIGNFYSAATFCVKCHITYSSATTHPTGSAAAGTGGDSSENMSTYCANCHGSSGTQATVAPARPIPAQDYHGFNSLQGGGLWPTINARPYGFIRNTTNYVYHRPYRGTETALQSGSATCSGGSTQCAGNSGLKTYTPGGSY